MIPLAQALAQIEARADPARAEAMAAYHKIPRRYLGVPVPDLDALAKGWREGAGVEDRVALAAGLWDKGRNQTVVCLWKGVSTPRNDSVV